MLDEADVPEEKRNNRRQKAKNESHFLGISKVENVWYTVDESGKRKRNVAFEIKYIDNAEGQDQQQKGVDINKKSMYLNQTAVIWVF